MRAVDPKGEAKPGKKMEQKSPLSPARHEGGPTPRERPSREEKWSKSHRSHLEKILVNNLVSYLFAFSKMGTIKDRNGMDLTEEKILRRGGKNTQKNCTKKIFMTKITMMV